MMYSQAAQKQQFKLLYACEKIFSEVLKMNTEA